jgi:hypothetical protein
MNKLTQFLDKIKAGEVPEESPIELMNPDLCEEPIIPLHDSFSVRGECNKRGMWAIVDLKWTKNLANWIGDRKCLEVMAGAGWLSKALSHHGIDVIATDDYSWDKQHSEMEIVYPVEKMSGVEAVKKYVDRDILIVSWPPYESTEICDICNEWGKNKPIVYIGEGIEGCNAPNCFWAKFNETDDPTIMIPRWWGIHDELKIGKWNREELMEDVYKTEEYLFEEGK